MNEIPQISTRIRLDSVEVGVQTALFEWFDTHNEEIKALIAAHFAACDVADLINREVDIQLRDSIKRGVEKALRYNSVLANHIGELVSESVLEKLKERES